ncbi:MAG TPA: RodZ domain-containing protein [Bacillota bacterium]|nr:RodZ domain-containing protein [Bacillota bacterium]
MEIGGRLKEAREELDISLDTLQEQTKIQKRYLVAIENGDFHVLPGTFYSRAFIKEYAIAVGLDPNELLEEYKDQVPSTEEDPIEPYTRMQRSRKRDEQKSTAVFSFIPTFIVVLLVIGILFIAWTLYQKTINSDDPNDTDEPRSDSIIRNPDDKKGTDDEDDEEPTEDEEPKDNDEGNSEDTEDEEEEVDEEHTWEITETGSGSRPESRLLFTSGTKEVEVTLETEDETWLSVKDEEGSLSIDQLFTKADSPMDIDVSDVNQLYIKLGNASNTTISMNGEEMEFPVDPKQHVVQTLRIDIEKPE